MFFYKHKERHFRLGLAVLALGWGLTLFAYVAVQQSLRLGANDGLARVAQAGAMRLSSVEPKAAIGSISTTAPGGELYPDVYVFDEQGKPVATNLNSANTSSTESVQAPPAGTFNYARIHADDRFTWQPASGSRQAAVLVHNPDDKGFVMATRSLVEPEALISKIGELAAVTMVGVVGVATIASLL
jgi:hypothetical protein